MFFLLDVGGNGDVEDLAGSVAGAAAQRHSHVGAGGQVDGRRRGGHRRQHVRVGGVGQHVLGALRIDVAAAGGEADRPVLAVRSRHISGSMPGGVTCENSPSSSTSRSRWRKISPSCLASCGR